MANLHLKIEVSKLSGTFKRKEIESGSRRLIIIAENKVADTRPRFKGRFVSVEQADEYNKIQQDELNERLRKERIFIINKIDKKTGGVLRTIYPTYESFIHELEHKNTSENESHNSRCIAKGGKEMISFISEFPMSR